MFTSVPLEFRRMLRMTLRTKGVYTGPISGNISKQLVQMLLDQDLPKTEGLQWTDDELVLQEIGVHSEWRKRYLQIKDKYPPSSSSSPISPTPASPPSATIPAAALAEISEKISSFATVSTIDPPPTKDPLTTEDWPSIIIPPSIMVPQPVTVSSPTVSPLLVTIPPPIPDPPPAILLQDNGDVVELGGRAPQGPGRDHPAASPPAMAKGQDTSQAVTVIDQDIPQQMTAPGQDS